MKENSWVSMYVEVAIPISALRSAHGAIPQSFAKCFISECARPSAFILCAVVEDEDYSSERHFAETSAQALSQELRAEYGTNLELPVCELHSEGAATN